jgi:hypothetical protein
MDNGGHNFGDYVNAKVRRLDVETGTEAVGNGVRGYRVQRTW